MKFIEIFCPNSNKKVIGFDIFDVVESENILKKYTDGYKQHDTQKNKKKEVLCLDIVNNTETIYKSIYVAGKVLNIVPASIDRVCKGIQHTAI